LTGVGGAGWWTLRRVMAAGIAIIASMATTIQAQIVGLGSP